MQLMPVIMCGGAGSRLWPRSRMASPKQFLRLVGQHSLLGATIDRFSVAGREIDVLPPLVICGADQERLVMQSLAEVGCNRFEIVVEPVGRNTAAVAAVASLISRERAPGAMTLLLPADHHVETPGGFWRAVNSGREAAAAGYLVTLGIEATGPETGYGYIRRGAGLFENVYAVHEFKEKPDAMTAEDYLRTGQYYWNAGIFLFRPDDMLAAFEAHAPDILAACRAALASATETPRGRQLGAEAFRACPDAPVDTAIMEKAGRVAVVAPVRAGWNDIGSWDAIAGLKVNGSDNASAGDVVLIGSKGCLVEAEHRFVAAVGVEDLVVIETADAVLICRRGQTQDVKKVVETLKRAGRKELL